MRPFILLLTSAVVASCAYGMTDTRFSPARNPSGIQTHVITASSELRGELIELQDSGMVILSFISPNGESAGSETRVLRLVPYSSIRHARFNQLKSPVVIQNGRAPTGDVRERLRLVSRFPYGMSPEVLAALLKALGQTALAGVN